MAKFKPGDWVSVHTRRDGDFNGTVTAVAKNRQDTYAVQPDGETSAHIVTLCDGKNGDTIELIRLPACAAVMGCLCAGHARGSDVDAPCDTRES